MARSTGTAPAARLARMERAYTPWPGLFTTLGGKRLILHGLSALSAYIGDAAPGTIVAVESEGLRVRTGDGDVRIARVQPEGKAPMAAAAFVASRPHLVGTRLGTVDADIAVYAGMSAIWYDRC